MSGRGIPVAVGDVLLGKYRVERVLGKGGMGVVVAARHIDLEELFAVKLMLDPEASPGAVERFLREARAAAKLKGEHGARVQDVGRLPDGTPYMIMEYLAGSDLRRIVRERGALPAAEAVTYTLQACETLSEAHSLGIIHRDVKPANMFLTRRRNGSPCVKLLDFGISKHTQNTEVSLTITTTFGGSPLYMSPEQMRSAKHVDGRTDIWSVGVVLYELLTATSPFQAETITAVAGRVLQDDPPPPSLVARGVPPSLDAVVLRCLAKRPDDRFATMDDLIFALRAAMDGYPGMAFRETELPTLPIGRGSLASIAGPLTHTPAVASSQPFMGVSSSGASSPMGVSSSRAPAMGVSSSGAPSPVGISSSRAPSPMGMSSSPSMGVVASSQVPGSLSAPVAQVAATGQNMAPISGPHGAPPVPMGAPAGQNPGAQGVPGSTSVGFVQTSSLPPLRPARTAIPLLLVLGGALAAAMAIGGFVLFGSSGSASPGPEPAAAAPADSPSPDSPPPAPAPTVVPAPEPSATATVTATASATAAPSAEPVPAQEPAAPEPLAGTPPASTPAAKWAPPASSPAADPKPAGGSQADKPPALSPKPSATAGKKRRTID